MVTVNRQLGIDNSDSYVTAAKYDAPSTYILNTDGGYVESSVGAVPDATWQYLTAVQDGADMLLYSNGVLVGSTSGASGDYVFTTTLTPPDATLPVTYLWDNGDTTSTTLRSLVPGTATLTVTATNCAAASVTDSHTITILAYVYLPLVLR